MSLIHNTLKVIKYQVGQANQFEKYTFETIKNILTKFGIRA
jgi:hypothetical protein